LEQQRAKREAVTEVLTKEKAEKTALVSPPPVPSRLEFPPTSTALALAPTSMHSLAPGPGQTGDAGGSQSSFALKTDLPIDGDHKGQKKLSWRQKVRFKLQFSPCSDKGRQVPEESIMDQ
jgi:hypothetical protein